LDNGTTWSLLGYGLAVQRVHSEPGGTRIIYLVTDDLPNRITDFLMIETIRHVATQGGGGLDLNFAVMRPAVSGERTDFLARWGAAQQLVDWQGPSWSRCGASTPSTARARCRVTSSWGVSTSSPARDW